MADRLKRLEWELGLAAAPSPFAMDPKTICRRVEATLSAEEQERKCYMKYKLRLAAVLTAAILALTGTALAAGPVINEMLQAALGAFAPYAQEIKEAAVCDGIQVKVVSALADSTQITVYAEITDLTGDRLKALNRFTIANHYELKLEGENHFSWGYERLAYDPETKTALISMTRNLGAKLTQAIPATVVIDSIQPGYHSVLSKDDIPLEGLTSASVPSQILPTGETVLVPNETEREIPNADGVSLAAVGFADDGRFHILFRLPDEAILELSHCNATPQAQPEEGRLNHFWGATVGESGKSEWPKDGTYDENKAAFEQDGKKYYDVSYVHRPGGPELPESLSFLWGSYCTMEPVKGPWEIPITIEPVNGVVSPLSGIIDHSALKELELSPLGIHITSKSEDFTQIVGYPMVVYLSDGAILHLERTAASYPEDGSVIGHWYFDRPMKVSDITGVALGCWMIPVEDGVAGEGYWLSALPK